MPVFSRMEPIIIMSFIAVILIFFSMVEGFHGGGGGGGGHSGHGGGGHGGHGGHGGGIYYGGGGGGGGGWGFPYWGWGFPLYAIYTTECVYNSDCDSNICSSGYCI